MANEKKKKKHKKSSKKTKGAAVMAIKEKLVSPLAPKGGFPEMPVIEGVEFSAVAAGVRYQGRRDVMMVRLAPGSTIAGVFTRSSTRSAPVLDCQAKIGVASDQGAAIIVNSGNSNAFTGAGGVKAVEEITAAAGEILNLPQDRIFTASTGVIGEPLPFEKITAKLVELRDTLTSDSIADAAAAFMTTDTFPKGSCATIVVEGEEINIAGIAKGSGMIAPDMATMLVYIFTDAKIAQPTLQKLVAGLTDTTFNCITVDSDTSTSDSLLMAATGTSKAPEIKESETASYKAFADALNTVMLDLAHQVIRDGEGATKFVEVHVTGAEDAGDARKVAMSIANSPLVKTAIAGEDPNWGRVVMAVGKSGAKADRDLLSIRFGEVLVAEKGWRAESYSEEAAAAYMQGEDLVIGVDMGLGQGECKVWTCDLTHRYIDINADYRS